MKRNTHSYKCTDQVYNKAKRIAKKDNTNVANIVEDFLKDYGKGEIYRKWKNIPEENK